MEPREYLLFLDDLRHQKLTFFRFVKKRCFAAVGRWGLVGGPASSVTMGIIIVIDQLSNNGRNMWNDFLKIATGLCLEDVRHEIRSVLREQVTNFLCAK